MTSLSRVRLLTTPWTAAHQTPPSLGFSRQVYGSGVPLPSPSVQYNLMEKALFLALLIFCVLINDSVYIRQGTKVKVTQLGLTLCDPVDYIVHGLLQARILEWVALPFSIPNSGIEPRSPALQADSLTQKLSFPCGQTHCIVSRVHCFLSAWRHPSWSPVPRCGLACVC